MHICTPIPSELLAFKGLPPLLARRTRRPWFPTRMSNLDSADHRTLFHFETIHFKWALAHRTWWRFWTMFTYGFLFCMTESCRWVMQCRLRARRPRASNKGLRPCPLCTKISPVSLNLLMLLCTVDDEICKAFGIWRWGTFSTIFLRTLSQIGDPLPIFTSERLCLS